MRKPLLALLTLALIPNAASADIPEVVVPACGMCGAEALVVLWLVAGVRRIRRRRI